AALEPIAQATPQPYAISLALGQLLERTNQYDLAFAHYEKANRSNPTQHSRQLIEARRDQIINHFTPDALASLPRPLKCNSSKLPRPILIVGMPRSGTSLVEQIISAHPSIAPAGESQALPELVAEMSKLGPKAANTQALTQLRDIYLDELTAAIETHTPPNELPAFITDKNPMNLFLIAHALAFIPDAIIVRVLRDPRDICLSCFASPLADDHTYKFTLDDCAHFAAAAHQTLEHFKPIIQADPRATWIDIRYEALTQDPETQINALFENLNLEPHPDCFTFHQSSRAVQTISRDQVRQPMHTQSIARWQNFAHLPQVRAMCQTLESAGVLPE
ncbi:MAG: sulfotransferase family protein, partial [Phycisphaerales bacterium]